MKLVRRIIFSLLLVWAVGATATAIAMPFVIRNREEAEFLQRHPNDRVLVSIKSEYKEAYLKGEITVESFEWDNIKEINFPEWSDLMNTAVFDVKLKKSGKQYVQEARNHFKTLDFVESVDYEGYQYAL